MRHLRWFFIFGLISAQSAQADWQYSRWGMSPDELVAASKGELKLSDPRSTYGYFVAGNHKLPSGLMLPVQARFTDNKLSAISITIPSSTAVGEIRGILRRTYGTANYYNRATKDCEAEGEQWKSDATNQYISLTLFKCGSQPPNDNLSIQPILKPGEGGL